MAEWRLDEFNDIPKSDTTLHLYFAAAENLLKRRLIHSPPWDWPPAEIFFGPSSSDFAAIQGTSSAEQLARLGPWVMQSQKACIILYLVLVSATLGVTPWCEVPIPKRRGDYVFLFLAGFAVSAEYHP